MKHNLKAEDEKLLSDFKSYMNDEGKSINTIASYIYDISDYLNWYESSFNKYCIGLYKANIQEYKSYLQTVRQQNARTINRKLSSLKKLNDFLITSGIQKDIVINDKMMIPVQTQYTSPATVSDTDIKQFLQSILEGNDNNRLRNYSFTVLLTFTGLRCSEGLNIRMNDFNLTTGELIVRSGKGGKQRLVDLNSKVIEALKDYIKIERNKESEYLFVSNKNDTLDRITINKIFKKYSKTITPHILRHFFCSSALSKGFSIHEVASICGHSNIQTTLLYLNPDRKRMKSKMELL